MLVDTYQHLVVSTCYAFVHQEEEARDIAQDVFVQIYQTIGTFRAKSKLSSWIYRIAVNHAINYCQSPGGKVKMLTMDQCADCYELTDEGAESQERIEKEERMAWLHRAIDRLPERQRVALILNKYEELSYEEIAEVTGHSLATVESLLYRARQNLEKWCKQDKE